MAHKLVSTDQNVAPGVSHHAANLANPRAEHYQNVASAYTAAELLALRLTLQPLVFMRNLYPCLDWRSINTLDRMPRIL